MAKIREYNAKGDPAAFAPDFNKSPEPYGAPIKQVLDCFDEMTPGSSILDVAGGYGRYAIELLSHGFNVTIVDIHEDSLREASKRFHILKRPKGRLNTVNVDILRDDYKPPKNKKFDAFLCIGFLHHLEESMAHDLFKRMFMLLKPGGIAVIELSTNKNRRYPSGEPIFVGDDVEHNSTYQEGLEFIDKLYDSRNFRDIKKKKVKLYERQPDFWYDADMIVASGIKN